MTARRVSLADRLRQDRPVPAPAGLGTAAFLPPAPAGQAERAWSTAWPVPRRSACSTYVRSGAVPTVARTSSAARPTTRTTRAPSARVTCIGYSIRGRPQKGCSTLGRRERIRLDSPAARMMAVRVDVMALQISTWSAKAFARACLGNSST